MVFGGDFKHDSLKWRSKALSTVEKMGLNWEIDPTNLETDTASHLANRTQENALLLALKEAKERRRRVWWLLYAVDRHTRLSYNAALRILDARCQVFQPLPERIWQGLDMDVSAATDNRCHGPATRMTGVGSFEYFLPLMVIPGDIIDIYHRRCHPCCRHLVDEAAISQMQNELDIFSIPLKYFEDASALDDLTAPDTGSQANDSSIRSPFSSDINRRPLSARSVERRVVLSYCTCLMHVLHVLLYGKWYPISMLDDEDRWTATESFMKYVTYAVMAVKAIREILEYDQELSSMLYLLALIFCTEALFCYLLLI